MEPIVDAAIVLDTWMQELTVNPSYAAERFLSSCCDLVGGVAGRLLVLDPETGSLVSVGTYGDPVWDVSAVSVDVTDYGQRPDVETVDGVRVHRARARRNGVVIGSVEFGIPAGHEEDVGLVTAIAKLLPVVRANEAMRAGLRVQPPIPDLTGDERSFQSRVHGYLNEHTRASLVAVFHVDDRLESRLVFGPESPELRSFLESEDVRLHVGAAADDPGQVQYLTPTTFDDSPMDGGALICASTVARGADPRGDPETYVLLAGFPLEYRPSVAEVAVFRHSLGIAAHLNQVYGYLHEVAGGISSIAEIGSAITGLETSQIVRHHAMTQIDLAQNLLAEMKDVRGESAARLKEATAAIQEVASDLQQIKVATKAPSREVTVASLKEMWDSACAQVRWRFAPRRIELRYSGPDVDVVVAPDWYRQVFLNLLLNSADAYEEAGRRRGAVTLAVRPSTSDDVVMLTYFDDATGILPQHFLTCEVAEDVDMGERIFLPGVTSKSEGSGWGLYVTRNIVQRTPGGSIRFTEGRHGAVFDLTLKRATNKGAR